MNARRRRAPGCVCGVLLAAVAGCSAAPPRAAAPASAPATPPAAATPAPPAAAQADPALDWHPLMLVPFGTRFPEVSAPLHEVLVFHDPDKAAGDAQSGDCYAPDGPPPRWLGREAAQYRLCFSNDRLSRIDAAVPLDAAEAPALFARACAEWLATDQAPGSRCGGVLDGIAWSAHLLLAPDEPAVLVITLGP